jgi:hypothetical protein
VVAAVACEAVRLSDLPGVHRRCEVAQAMLSYTGTLNRSNLLDKGNPFLEKSPLALSPLALYFINSFSHLITFPPSHFLPFSPSHLPSYSLKKTDQK